MAEEQVPDDLRDFVATLDEIREIVARARAAWDEWMIVSEKYVDRLTEVYFDGEGNRLMFPITTEIDHIGRAHMYAAYMDSRTLGEAIEFFGEVLEEGGLEALTSEGTLGAIVEIEGTGGEKYPGIREHLNFVKVLTASMEYHCDRVVSLMGEIPHD